MFAQQEINCQPLLVDGPIKVSPSPSDFDVCLIYAPRRADRLSIITSLLFELRNIALDPSEDSGMRYSYSALSHHFYQVAIAEFVGDVPSDTENDSCAIKVTAVK